MILRNTVKAAVCAGPFSAKVHGGAVYTENNVLSF